MSTNDAIERPVGPVLQTGEVARAVAEAAVIDNEDRRVDVKDRGSYVRVEVDGGECVLRRETIAAELGRPFRMSELELIMPSFVGRIDTGSDVYRFYLGNKEGNE
ncbi:toluene monooxygenase system protein D [Prauserella sediminis]|uniref:Toluene monooxygenase system protein D n=1 Tax=Prauserella sediminis TaxID=577680 RepID=A0A839XSR8_9PSEU|nr:MmoB/DmpM family protein [Prauserella sediminis]MBB3664484.1 toluene monooxygenase system protein D [Prauserella sediminis]